MGVKTFESQVKAIPYPPEQVFAKLADLNNLSKLKAAFDDPQYMARIEQSVPADKLAEVRKAVESMTFDTDSVSVDSPMGQVRLVVLEREAPKMIKLAGEGLPVDANLWVQLLPHNGGAGSLLKATIKADLNIFIKAMVSKPLQKGVEKLADMLAVLPYGD